MFSNAMDTRHRRARAACRVLVTAVLVAHGAGCATTGRDTELPAMQREIATLRADVQAFRAEHMAELARLREDVEALRDAHSALAREQEAVAHKVVKELLSARRDAMKQLGVPGAASGPKAGAGGPRRGRTRRPRTPPRARPSREAEQLDATRWVEKVGKHRYHIDRRGMRILLANPRILARSVRIVPSIKDGRPNGFKLYAIRAGSIYHVLGLRNGDLVEKINGMDMTSPSKALEIYTRVRNAKKLTVAVRRRGAPIRFVYTIVPR